MFFSMAKKNPAQRRYMRRGRIAIAAYFVLFFGAFTFVNQAHPRGVLLYAVAALPALPMLSLLLVVGRYLREERDEFQRDLVIRCLLWGIAAMLVVELFTGFLRIFDWQGTVPPFTSFYAFCISMLVAKFTYRFRNRVTADE